MSLAQRITKEFGGNWHGHFGMIPSPGHSAKDRSTRVRDGESGDVVFDSFNGADWREIKDECRRRGLLPARANGGAEWCVTGTYVFREADGTPLYRTRRHECAGQPKRYTAERRRGDEWVNGLGDAKRVLYRLPELLSADPAAPVLFVEGERKADKLAQMGFVATAIAFGAKGWRREYAAPLADRSVIILPDNDEPGREFAARVRADAEKAGARAFILNLPGLPPKGDIIDWQGSADDLRSLTEALIGAASADGELLPLIDVSEWADQETPARAWALDEFIPDRQATLFTGKGSAGKSKAAQLLSTCAALGIPFLGVPTSQRVALYITWEDDADELHIRQKATAAVHGITLQSLKGRLFLKSMVGELGAELATFDGEGRLRETALFRQIVATAKAIGAQLIALDNSSHIFGGNENNRHEVAAFINLLNNMAREIDGAVVLIGHSNKLGDSFSGSTAWENQVRSRLFMEIPDPDVDADRRIIRREKANYARTGGEIAFRWHKGTFVRDEELPPNVAEDIAAVAAENAHNERFLACLAERKRQGRAVSERPSPSYAPKVFANMAEAKGSKKKDLERAMDRLFRLGRIERAELWKGPDRKPVFGLRETAGNRSPESAGHSEEMADFCGKCGAGDCAGNCAGDARETAGNHSRETAGDVRATHSPHPYRSTGGLHGPASPVPEGREGQ